MEKRTFIAVGIVLACASLALSACGSKDEGLSPDVEKLGRASGPVARGAGMPAAMEEAPRGAAANAAVVREGDVVERIHVPNYTYLRLRAAGGSELWAAVPKAEIEVGAHVRVVESIVMEKFASPSLGRTFDSIVFGVLDDAKPATSPDAGVAREPSALPPGHPKIAP